MTTADDCSAKRPEVVNQRNPGSLGYARSLPTFWLESVPCPSVSVSVRPCSAVEALVVFRCSPRLLTRSSHSELREGPTLLRPQRHDRRHPRRAHRGKQAREES